MIAITRRSVNSIKLVWSTDSGDQNTPIAKTAKDTMVLTWWFARQIIDADKVDDRSVGWQEETALAHHVLSSGGKTAELTRGLLQEELVSPSIVSENG